MAEKVRELTLKAAWGYWLRFAWSCFIILFQSARQHALYLVDSMLVEGLPTQPTVNLRIDCVKDPSGKLYIEVGMRGHHARRQLFKHGRSRLYSLCIDKALEWFMFGDSDSPGGPRTLLLPFYEPQNPYGLRISSNDIRVLATMRTAVIVEHEGVKQKMRLLDCSSLATEEDPEQMNKRVSYCWTPLPSKETT